MSRTIWLIGLSLIVSSCSHLRSGQADMVCFHHTCVNVEVVSTPEAMTKGLQGRTSLGEDSGMLFIFSELDRHLFWMKETLIPLDIIWMDQQRRIVDIRSNIPPCKSEPCSIYGPLSRSNLYALETNAGYCAKHNLKAGDQAEFKLNDVIPAKAGISDK